MIHRWQAKFTVNDNHFLNGHPVCTGNIEFTSDTPGFPNSPIPNAIFGIEVFSDKKPGEVFAGEVRDSFGGWPAFVGHNTKGEEVAFSLESQWRKVYAT